MKETPNYGFKKRELTDVADITQTEDNWDVIDQKLKEQEDELATKETPAGAQAKAEAAAGAVQAELDAHVAETVTDTGGVHGLEIEEGIWTPELLGVLTYSYQQGYYKKIGNTVYIACRVDVETVNTEPSVAWATGLPFVKDPNYAIPATIQFWGISLPTDSYGLQCSISGSRIVIQYVNSDDSYINLHNSTLSSNTTIRVSAMYKIQ